MLIGCLSRFVLSAVKPDVNLDVKIIAESSWRDKRPLIVLVSVLKSSSKGHSSVGGTLVL